MEWDNLVYAVNAGTFGNCSACGYRNWPKLCKQMTCQAEDFSYGVYWTAKIPGMDTGNIFPRIKEFHALPPDQIKKKCLEKIELVR